MTDDTVTATDWLCPKCGDTVSIQEPCEAWDCAYCGETMEPRDKSDVTPNDELRELIEEWRKQRTGDRDVDNAVEACANQLEALLDDE